MNAKKTLLLLVSTGVLVGSLALATHVQVPPVSNGGELAYVRNFPNDALEKAEAGAGVTATYVSWRPGLTGEQNPEKDRLERFASRGRLTDREVFHQVDLPDFALGTNISFVPVEQYERGIVLWCWETGRLASLNGVNAGLSLQATGDVEARYQVSGKHDGFDIVQVSPQRVNLSRDGHTYAVEARGNLTIDIDGQNLRVNLSAGDEIRSWIDGEYPATTAVMHAEFDHIAATERDCSVAPRPSPTPTPSPSPSPSPSPTPPPEEGADVGVTKTAEQDEANSTIVYTLMVVNHGPDTAVGDGVYVNDTLPDIGSQWFLGGPDSEACTLDERSLVCRWMELPAGESRTVTVTGYTQNLCPDEEFQNNATVWAENDSTPDNNTASAVGHGSKDCPPPPEAADVGAEKTAVQDEANDTATFTVVVSSLGPGDASNVTLTDELPDVQSEWFLGGPDSEACALEDRSLTCHWDTLAANETRTVTATAYTANVCPDDEIVNTARVSADDDANADNNESSASARGTKECADVSVNKTVAEDEANTTATFTMAVRSLGPDDAANVTLSDELPDVGSEWFLGGPDSEACTLSDRSLECHWDTLASGESRAVAVTAYTANVCRGDEISNAARVSADDDTNADNDESTAVAHGTKVCADASVNKTASQNADSVTFTIAVNAQGPEPSTNVVMTDELPDTGSQWMLGGADSEFCTQDGRVLTCSYGDLAPGESRMVTVKAYTDNMACGQNVDNTARVSSDNDDNSDNDASTATIQARAC